MLTGPVGGGARSGGGFWPRPADAGGGAAAEPRPGLKGSQWEQVLFVSFCQVSEFGKATKQK